MQTPNIYEYIKSEENDFESDEMRLGDNWNWKFRDHVQMIFHLVNSRFFTGANDWLRAFKNIMEPLIDLANWTEDIEVKDIAFYIESENGRVLSFLVKKYHDEVYAREHNIDEFIDQITEHDNTYGGVLAQKTNEFAETVELNTIAFGDQTDLLAGPIGFRHHFSPDGLRKMKKAGWGDEKNGATISIDELITLVDFEKEPEGLNDTKTNQVPGKVIEVYIVRGNLPEHYLKENDNMEDYYNQVQIVAFYTDKNKKRHGVTLYRQKEKESNLKFHTAKPVSGRALGRGVGERLLHPQIWTNFLTIHKTNLLEAASKVVLQTDDPNYQNANQIQDMENLEITTTEEGRKIDFVPTVGAQNITVLSNAVNEWFEYAQLDASAQDPILGKEAVSGTTFRGQERTVAQGRGSHDRKRGKRAKFIEHLYREWFIPDMARKIKRGKKFLATLSADELQWVAEQLATNYANKRIKETLFTKGVRPMTQQEQQEAKRMFKEQFSRSGNRQLVEILKDEFKDVEIKMGINVANKQKNLADLSDKVLSIFQFVLSNPQQFQQAMQIPALAKSFNDILEYSGMSSADFQTLMQPSTPQQPVLPEQGQRQQMQLNREEANV